MGDRERSRSPERDGSNGAAPANGGGAGEEAEGVKLYVGNLDYCECNIYIICVLILKVPQR